MKVGLSRGPHSAKIGLGSFLTFVALLLVLFAVPGQAQEGFSAKINFQPDTAPVPTGYTKDTGAPYDSARGFGWVEQDSLGNATPTPLDISPNTRDRNTLSDQRLDTLTHMQFPPDSTNTAAVKTPAAWEYKLPNGTYDVTVAVGDPSVGNDPEEHTINFEGKNAIDKFVPSGAKGAATRNKTATIAVSVTDGKLTMDAIGGTNTKPNYVEITSAATTNERPSVAGSKPADGATNVALSSGVATTSLNLVNSGVENSTITNSTVKLIKVGDGSVVPSDVNGTGGGDAITLTPVNKLQPNTQYRFEISDGVKDLDGLAFKPFSSTFTTGTTEIFNPPGVTTGDVGNAAFDRVAQPNAPSKTYTSVEMGPDDRLYAATVEGEIYRFPVDAQSGELSSPTLINTVRDNTNDCNTSTIGDNGCTDKRLIMGITFEPGSTASNPKLWVSHSTYGYRNMKDWGGKLSVLSGSNLGQYRDVLTNVPRSSKDHQINSIAFHSGKIYIPVGATTAMGAYDDAWKGTERLLSTSIIEVDYQNITGTLNTKTVEAGGPYNPYASGAPVKIYATGVRNAVDLVWHSNGQLYVPTNGSAGGSNAPATPQGFADTEACKSLRADGPYTGPGIPNFDGDNTDPRNANGKEIDPNTGELQPRMKISKTQEDYLYRVEKDGYYGNPNPVRCEWVLNGGNPTAGSGNDPGENPAYPDGTKPDRNWRGWAYNFQNNQSPNGAIEYKGDNFGGKLKGKLLVVRYSNGDDIVVLHPNGGNGDINQQNIGVPGLAKNSNGQVMVDPLDLIEDTRSGNLYVTEGVKNPPDNTGKITLLRARDTGEPRPANISLDKQRLLYNAVQNSNPSAQQTVTVKNEGGSDLNISGVSLSGANAGQFKISAGPTGSVTLTPGEMQEIGVVFDPTSIGPKGASLDIASNDTDTAVAKVNLRGLGTKGTGGSNEPSLQWILDTYEIPVKTGDPDPTNNAMPTDPLLGDEVKAQRFEAASDSPVTVEPLVVFGPDANDPVLKFGHYTASDAASKQELFQVSNSPKSNAQTLNVPGGEKSFDPGSGAFGFYSTWPFFNNRDVYTQDSLNTFNGAIPHHVRTYPLPGEQNAYVVATEETTSGFDYQDVVVIVRNVKPLAAASRAEIDVQNLDATRVGGEPALGLYDDWMTFSRINGGVATHKFHDTATLRIKNTDPNDALEISDLKISDTTEFSLPNGEKTLAIAPGDSKDVQVKFVESAGTKGIREQTLTIFSNDADEPRTVVQLRGAFMTQPEGNNEVTLTQIAQAFSYTSEIGQPLQEANDTPLAGDEVRSKLWKRVDTSTPVYARQLAAYHGSGGANFQITGTGGGSFGHDGAYFQSVLPIKGDGTPAELKVSPTGNFEIKIAGFSTNTDGNLGVRMWPVKDRDGKIVPNAYYVGQDYVGNGCGAGSANCDYNDNVFLITDVQPVTLPAPIDLAAAGGDGQVELSWTSLTNSSGVGYNIYRSKTEQVDTSGTPLNGSTPLTKTSYTDSTVTNGTTYYYAVVAVEGSQKSRSSKAVSATPTEPSSNTDFKVNFQNAAAPVPSGYLRDFGQPYGARAGADQGSGQSYGWIEPGTSTPLDFTKNGRDRDRAGIEQRLDTVIHMQYGDIQPPGSNGNLEAGAWEIAVPDGTYDVTVSVGDQPGGGGDVYDSQHSINIEGKSAIDKFQATAQNEYKQSTVTVDVTDGELTMDAIGGNNTKPNYVEIVGNTATATNQAPTVTRPEDQTNVEGENVSLQVEANDPDQGDTLTYEATGLPAGLSIDPATGKISGTIKSGAAQQDPYTAKVTATDDGNLAKSDTATFNWTVTAPQASGCPPRSTLDCAKVPVALPYNTTFDGTESGLKDTGFTMVDPPSAPLTTPSNPDVPGYEPGNLTVADGELTIKSTQGIMYVKPAKSDKTNSQVNALGVGVNAAGKTTRIETNTTVPAFPSTVNDSEQGGLWFGLDEDNYAKLVVVNTGGGNAKIQLYREIGAVSNGEAGGDEVNSANVTKNGDALKLAIVADATAGNVTAFYTVGSGQEVKLGTLPVPANFFAGTKLSQSSTETVSFAGIFDTNRRGTTPINMSFKDFSVAPQSQPQPNKAPVANDDTYNTDEDATLTVPAVDGVLSNDTDADTEDTLKATLVDDVKSGALTLNANGSFSYKPNSGFSGKDSFTYKANDGTDNSNVGTVSITVKAINHAPSIEQIGDQTATAGESFALQVKASDPDQGDTLTYAATGLPQGLKINPDTGEISGTIASGAATGSPYSVKVTVTDGTDTATQNFQFQVKDPADTTPPATPTGFKATASDAGIALAWSANSEADLAGYNVYLRTADETDFTKLNTNLITDLQYNDTKAPEGVTSYYRLIAVDKAGNESNFALDSAKRPIMDTEAPATPTGFTATASQSGIALDWANNSESDLAGYNVSRRTEDETEFTKLNNALLTDSKYDDAKAPAGKTSYYRVTAVDKVGNESNFAAESAFRPEQPSDTAAPNTSITGGPSGFTKSRTARFTFKSSEDGSTFECKLDGGSFESCDSPKVYSDLPDGRHTFQVKATDKAGNTDGSPAIRLWTVDTKAPVVSKIRPTGKTSDRTPTIKATIRDTGSELTKSNIRLYVDGRFKGRFAYSQRTDRLAYTQGLSRGRHTVKIIATDKAGNRVVKTWRFRVL